jgi:hypothetical protein
MRLNFALLRCGQLVQMGSLLMYILEWLFPLVLLLHRGACHST